MCWSFQPLQSRLQRSLVCHEQTCPPTYWNFDQIMFQGFKWMRMRKITFWTHSSRRRWWWWGGWGREGGNGRQASPAHTHTYIWKEASGSNWKACSNGCEQYWLQSPGIWRTSASIQRWETVTWNILKLPPGLLHLQQHQHQHQLTSLAYLFQCRHFPSWPVTVGGIFKLSVFVKSR